jgi:hypothetical protein
LHIAVISSTAFSRQVLIPFEKAKRTATILSL